MEIKVHGPTEIRSPECERSVRIGHPSTGDWTMVTCGACRLEQPMVAFREHRTPDHVAAMDAALVARDTLRRMRGEVLKSIEETEAALRQARETLEHVMRRLSEAETVVRGLTQGPGTAEVSQGRTEPLKGLSEAALDALRNCGTDRIGGTVRVCLAELRKAGMIGPQNGLTVEGSILAERLQAEEMDRLFGTRTR